MTNYEKLVAAGPQALATLIVESKIKAASTAFEKLGLTYGLGEDVKQDIFNKHLEYLNSECEEVKHD